MTMNKQLNKVEKPTIQKLEAVRGRAMLEWYGKAAPKSIEWYPAQLKESYGNPNAKEFNRLYWGDNKQVLAHLLKEFRGKVDLVYIDPPFDSKADYVKKVKIKGQQVLGTDESVLEEMQYTDIWEKDEYLQFMYERLIILRELLSDTGSIYLHCDWHRNSHLRLLMDEVFGEENIRNEIVWFYRRWTAESGSFQKMHDNILYYTKSDSYTINPTHIEPTAGQKIKHDKGWDRNSVLIEGKRQPQLLIYNKAKVQVAIDKGQIDLSEYARTVEVNSDKTMAPDVWEINYINSQAQERLEYPTQKAEALLQRIIEASSNPGDLVLDCFAGSGTTMAVAQKLGRRWIGCDINKGAIITSTERLNKILLEQKGKLLPEGGLDNFKVYNVNHYDVFNNEMQAKELIMQAYKVEKLPRSDFDGLLGTDLVKIISPNRVLTKMDIKEVMESIKKNADSFIAKVTSKQTESLYNNKVIIICSGQELDVRDYIKKENRTGVEIEVRDMQVDKKDLGFKKPTEAIIHYTIKDKELTVEVADYYSPLLMKRLELENENRLDAQSRVKLFDFRQAIEHIGIDVNYGEDNKKGQEVFNAEAFLHKPKKTELVPTAHKHEYSKKGKYTVAVKIVDVLGEEYFETKEITV